MENKLKALINLLDDPDEKVFSLIREELISFGDQAIPALEEAWENYVLDDVFQQRIEEILHQIQFDAIKNGIRKWKLNGSKNLLEGVLLINKYQYPDINNDEITNFIGRVKQDVWLEINDTLTPYEKINILNKVFFGLHHFKGNRTNFHSPHNCYISDVIETKKGNPLSLSILYILVAQSLQIPIYGINLPSHFIVGYKNEGERFSIFEEMTDENLANEILCYINPFSRGVLLSKEEIDSFLKELKIEAKPEYFNPCSNYEIIRRMIINLIISYQKNGYPEKEDEVKQLLEILEEK